MIMHTGCCARRLHTLLLVPSKIVGCGDYHIPEWPGAMLLRIWVASPLASCYRELPHSTLYLYASYSYHKQHQLLTPKPFNATSGPRRSGYRSHPHLQLHVQQHCSTQVCHWKSVLHLKNPGLFGKLLRSIAVV